MVWGDGTWWTDSPIWSLIFGDGPKWSEISEMVLCGQRWSWMVKNGPIFSEMVTDGPRWDNPIWSDDPGTLWVHFKQTLGTLRPCIVLSIESSLHSTITPKFNRLPCSASVVIEFHNFTQSFCNARIFKAVQIVHFYKLILKKNVFRGCPQSTY